MPAMDGRLLIVLDQFEEFVILADPERQKAFAALVADLHATPIKGLRLLLQEVVPAAGDGGKWLGNSDS